VVTAMLTGLCHRGFTLRNSLLRLLANCLNVRRVSDDLEVFYGVFVAHSSSQRTHRVAAHVRVMDQIKKSVLHSSILLESPK